MLDPSDEEAATASALGALVLAVAVTGASFIHRLPEPARPIEPPGGIALRRPADSTPPTGRRSSRRIATSGSTFPQRTRKTASSTPTATAAATAAATATATAPTGSLPAGRVDPPSPFFTFARPFEAPHELLASRYYPYGTTAGGAYLLHHGVDIGNPTGTPVRAVGAGLVVFAGADDKRAWGPTTDFYGQLVVVRHNVDLLGSAIHSLYGHLSAVNVRAGDRLAVGDVVGEVGATGIALGPHLHLEFRAGGINYQATRNPELLLAPLPGRGTIVGRMLGPEGAPRPGIEIGLYEVTADGADWMAGTTSYPEGPVNPLPPWDEGFVFADLPAGRYRLSAQVGGQRLATDCTVRPGDVQIVTLRP